MTFSFAKKDRLLKRSEFIRVSKSGRHFYSRHFLLVTVPGTREGSRIGITVSKKVSRKATVRNRIKRSCREYFRQNRDRIAGKRDIHIIAGKDAAELTATQTFHALQTVFDRISKAHGD